MFSDRSLWIIVSMGLLAAVVLAVILGVIATQRPAPVTSSAPTTSGNAAMQQWWSAAHEHFDELQGALDASREELKRGDGPALAKSCQQMHDAGTVKLRAHLPAPEPDLTAELDAAINDAHEAAHECLAAVSGSLNNYFGEFAAYLDQVEIHLKAALELVNKNLLTV